MNEPVRPGPPAGARPRRLKVLALAVLVVGVALDLGSKAYFENLLGMDPGASGPFRRIEVIPGLFALEGAYNPGVTFGLAPGQTGFILAFTVLATLALVVWLLWTRRRSVLLHVALGMVLAGALGNLYDRVHWHEVRDFFLIYAGDWRWPNFNVADAMIVLGVVAILWEELFGRRKPSPRTAAEGTT